MARDIFSGGFTASYSVNDGAIQARFCAEVKVRNTALRPAFPSVCPISVTPLGRFRCYVSAFSALCVTPSPPKSPVGLADGHVLLYSPIAPSHDSSTFPHNRKWPKLRSRHSRNTIVVPDLQMNVVLTRIVGSVRVRARTARRLTIDGCPLGNSWRVVAFIWRQASVQGNSDPIQGGIRATNLYLDAQDACFSLDASNHSFALYSSFENLWCCIPDNYC